MPTTMTPQYNTMLFTQVFPDVTTFINEYTSCGIPTTIQHGATGQTEQTAQTLFYLLYAQYGNNPIANRDLNQFKMKLFSLVFQYGPAWEKRLIFQKKIRDLSDTDILEGSKTIANHSYNPSSDPATSSLTELETINDQNTSNLKRGKLEAYAAVLGLLEDGFTDEFIRRFGILFKKFVLPENPLLYATDESEGD